MEEKPKEEGKEIPIPQTTMPMEKPNLQTTKPKTIEGKEIPIPQTTMPMEKPNLQTTKPKTIEGKEIPIPQTTKPKTMPMEKPNLQTTKPKTIEIEMPKEEQKQVLNTQPTTKPKELEKLEQPKTTKRVVWDCESSLYDSFELKSFERQLDSAIAARTLSMPHLSDHRSKPPPPPQPKKQSKISRSLNKFIRSVFRPKQNNNDNGSKSSSWFRVEKGSREGVYYVYDTSGSLTTIPEAPESSGSSVGDFDALSPDLKSFVRRTASDRFAPASLGISCA